MTSPSPTTTDAPSSKGRLPSHNSESGARPSSPDNESPEHPLASGRGLLRRRTRSEFPANKRFKPNHLSKPSNDQESSKAKESKPTKKNEVPRDGALEGEALNEAHEYESAKENEVLNCALKKKSLDEAEASLAQEHEISGAGTSKSRDLSETKESPAKESECSSKGSGAINPAAEVGELKESGNSSQHKASDQDLFSQIPSNVPVNVPHNIPSNVSPSDTPSPILSKRNFPALPPNFPSPMFACNISFPFLSRTPSPKIPPVVLGKEISEEKAPPKRKRRFESLFFLPANVSSTASTSATKKKPEARRPRRPSLSPTRSEKDACNHPKAFIDDSSDEESRVQEN
ncbi:hypothetical protein CYLTODRAFT_447269 [Cylindrobasidium torrendii FP15055 ss-10]|uniref:Uncharacterized protein n=1 Tax=Cylindrobasidium torrendii FP15055 ss-10 TaxID=1314674 RepID=A0A0D7AWU5_9AGAR|nr:hypothetical protein CYLTODRAFT_447269 [Cylindrobasidium torrendii FP15055 ss-10]